MSDFLGFAITIVILAVLLAGAIGLAIWPSYKPRPIQRRDVVERFEIKPNRRRWLS